MIHARTIVRTLSSNVSLRRHSKKHAPALLLAAVMLLTGVQAFWSPSVLAATFKINAGGTASGAWAADSKYSGGTAAKSTATVNTSKVTNPAPVAVYQSERWGNFTYTFSGLPANTDHTVRLHFNEFYYASVGQRIFSVQSNGVNILTDFDIIKESGGKNIAIAKDFTLKSNASGTIALKFTNAKADDPKVSGIELVTVTAPPVTDNTPKNLTASGVTTTGVNLSWTAPSNPSGAVQGYNVYQGSTKLTATPVTTTTYTVTGLTPSTAYSFSVKSVVGGVESAASNNVSVTTATPVPTSNTPTGLTSSNVTTTGVNLSWTAPSNPSGAVQGYNVYQGSTKLTGSPISGTAYAVTGLAPSTAYSFSVKSVVGGVESAASNAVQVTTLAEPPTGTTVLSRINAGGSASGAWAADGKYTGGSAATATAAVNTSKVTNPAPAAVYQSERWGDFTYTYSGLQPNADHVVRLHFNEFYWTNVGERVFDVTANGTPLLTNYDIVKEAGGANIAVAREFTVKSDANGTIRLAFATKVDAAKVSGIELSGPALPPPPPSNGAIFPAGQNVKVMAVGDSITYGQPSDSTGGFRMPLWDKMGALGWTFTPVGWQNGPPYAPYPTNSPYNGSGYSGSGGWTMNDFFNEGSLNWTGETIRTWMSRYTPDVMLLHIGTNDISKGDSQATLRNDFIRLLDTMIADRPNAYIFVAQIINYSTYQDPYVTEYNNMIANVVNERKAQGKRVYVVNMEAALANNAGYYSDYVHPNTSGYLKMADTWYDALVAANTAAITPAATTSNTPTNLTSANVTASNVGLSWAAPSKPSAAVQGYNIYRGTTKVNSSLVTTTSYTVSGLAAATTYSFSVKSVVGGAESAASNTISVTTTAAPAAGAAEGIVTLNFDDGRMSVYNNALPIMNRYGFKSTQYLVSDAVKDQWPNYMTATHAKELLSQGHEIGSHSMTHPYLTQLSSAQRATELQQSQSTLRSLVGPAVAANFASPYGDYNATTVADIRQYYGSHRSVDTGLNVRGSFDRYNIRVVNVGSATTLNDIKYWVDRAKATKAWAVLLYHGVDPTAVDEYSVSTASFEAHMNYIASTGISVQTTAQALATMSQ